jgi:hypothetical protein
MRWPNCPVVAQARQREVGPSDACRADRAGCVCGGAGRGERAGPWTGRVSERPRREHFPTSLMFSLSKKPSSRPAAWRITA